ncbi:unnamed protein product [Wuchereria bancrofti]|uniref:Uncharacterized protein n=1 Tax=Wuchereria bancrofti TaxID=6293 RepID=A0A3P7EP73_WUCBA|nr:unnamed protein product [Wuchereria bancrofti]
MDSSYCTDHTNSYSTHSNDRSPTGDDSLSNCHEEEQTQSKISECKLDDHFSLWSFYLRYPSMGALPREWLDPSRINFRTRKIAGCSFNNHSRSDDTYSEVGFSPTESNSV